MRRFPGERFCPDSIARRCNLRDDAGDFPICSSTRRKSRLARRVREKTRELPAPKKIIDHEAAMTTLLSVGDFINFLVIVVGIPYFLWGSKPEGASAAGTLWWVVMTVVIVVFAVISLVAALQLATDTDTVTYVLYPLGVLLLVFLYFTRIAPSRSLRP